MLDVICCSQIIGIGSQAKDFHEENMLITFKEGISNELSDYCIILSNNLITHGDLAINQKLTLGKYSYIITAVGKVAAKNFEILGHITIIFDGVEDAKLDGAIHVLGEYPLELAIGDSLSIKR